MKILAHLFFSFFKIGLFTFGGGYAMLPLLKHEVVTKQNWLTEDELLNYFSIGQCTPGIIAVNIATLCGYKLKKTIGAIVATLAVILPSFICILLIAGTLRHFANHPNIVHVLSGIRIGVTALLINIICRLCTQIYQNSSNKILSGLIFVFALLGLLWLRLSAVFIILSALFVSIVLFMKRCRI